MSAAPEFVPPFSEEPEPYHFVSAREFCSREPSPSGEPLLGGLVSRGHRLVIAGATGHGKSTLALQILTAIVQGHDCLGFTGIGDSRAAILDCEQAEDTVRKRLRQIGLADSDNVNVCPIPGGLSLDRNAIELDWLERVLERTRPDILLLDPLNKLHTADFNDNQAMDALMRRIDGWRSDYGTAVILAAHLRKSQATRGPLTINDVAGAGAVTHNAETVVGIQSLPNGRGKLHFWKARNGNGLPVHTHWKLQFDLTAGGYVRDLTDGTPKVTASDTIRDFVAKHPGSTYDEMRAGTGLSDSSVRSSVRRLGCVDDRSKPKRWSLPPKDEPC